MPEDSKINIKEIFTSIQGEGPYLGELQTFIRFTKCNLNCNYCDTDYKNGTFYSGEQLYKILQNEKSETISLTGGEPLLEADFLYNFLKKYKLNKKIYLETNGTLYRELKKIIDFVDVVSMDIKLKSATKEENRFKDNEEFLKTAKNKEHFIKIVFDNNITDNEIIECLNLAKKYDSKIILQPKMPMDNDLNIEEIFYKFFNKYQNVRIIPQTHKFLNIK